MQNRPFPASDFNVQELRLGTLDLHRALLDVQRLRYERDHGRIATSGALLSLVLEHPAFAWLRTLSALIARLDEWVEAKDNKREADLVALLDALKGLIAPDGNDRAFNKPYWEIVHEVPDVLVAHVKLWRLIQTAGTSTPRAETPRG